MRLRPPGWASCCPPLSRDLERELITALTRLLATQERADLYREIAETLSRLLDCDETVLYLRKRGRTLRAVSDAGRARHRSALAQQQLLAAVAAQALVERRPLLNSEDHKAEPRDGASNESLLALPLLASECPLGVIVLCRRRPGARFAAEECERAAAFASLAAVTLERAGREAALSERARRDPLTGLLNHRECQRVLAEALRRQPPSFAVVMLDIDDLKLINDRYGHLRGDELLRSVARVIRRAIRRDDLAFRIGGDEFLLVLSRASEAEARRVTERIEHELSRLPTLAGLAISYGIGFAPTDGDNWQQLLRRVDARLYDHKRRRKTRRHPTKRPLDASAPGAGDSRSAIMSAPHRHTSGAVR